MAGDRGHRGGDRGGRVGCGGRVLCPTAFIAMWLTVGHCDMITGSAQSGQCTFDL